MEDKYKNDRYDRELYIPKGYILPDGTMLTKKYARFHEDMAERFIMENYYNSFMNDIIKDKKDYMLMRLGAIQVMSCGMPIILFCEGNHNKIIQDAIVSYLSYGWDQQIIPNPYKSYFDYMRMNLLKECELMFFMEEKDEKEIINKNILKRCRKI